MPKGLKLLAVFSTLVMLFVQIGGALVTKTESGMGCGRSWPLCEGELIPTFIDTEKLIELSHRLVSGLSVIIVVALAVWAWKRIGHVRETKFLAITAVLSLIAQAFLGAGAVIWGQAPVIMALHFGVSLLSFASVFLLTLLIFEVDKKFDADSLIITEKIRKQIYLLVAFSYIVIYTGALVRQQKATLICLDFPFCSNENIGLPSSLPEWSQMGHRVIAVLFFIWVLILTIKVARNFRHEKTLYWGMMSTLILSCLQVITGILTIFTGAHLFFTLSHALIITCIFGVLTYLMLLANRSSKNANNKGEEVA